MRKRCKELHISIFLFQSTAKNYWSFSLFHIFAVCKNEFESASSDFKGIVEKHGCVDELTTLCEKSEVWTKFEKCYDEDIAVSVNLTFCVIVICIHCQVESRSF